MLVLLSLLLFGYAHSELVGPVTIMEDGEAVTRYVVSTYAPLASVSGTTISLQHDAQVQIAANQSDDYSPYMFASYKLQDKTLSFVADLSSISCSCNMAFYFVTMPAIGSDGQPVGGNSGDYYCDANDVNGELCWEMDVMEANMYVSATTPHSCDQAPGQPTYSCDGGGCGTNSHNVNGNGMCPGGCTINTQSPFNFSISFGGTMHVKMTQNDQTFEFDACNNGGYVSNMNQALDYGMVMVMSYWGTDYNTMSWLDGMTGCSGDCDTSGTAKFSDITITSNNKKSSKTRLRKGNW